MRDSIQPAEFRLYSVAVKDTLFRVMFVWGVIGMLSYGLTGFAQEASPPPEDPAETCRLGVAYLHGVGVPRDPREGVKRIVASASAGDTAGKTWLGHLYRTGLVLPYDPKAAFRLYLEAAVENYPAARYAVAESYLNGRGVTPNPLKADVWFQRTVQAAETGEAELDGESARAIGLCYRDGRGTDRNDREAVRWLLYAGKSGNARALFELGAVYENGLGVEVNARTASGLYEKAADAGSAHACLALARIAAEGIGTEPDLKKATTWTDRALDIMQQRATLGSVEDATDLYQLYAEGRFVDKDQPRAITWLQMASDRNYGRALTRLGRTYAIGDGVDIDLPRAVILLQTAAVQHEAEAHFLLWKLYRSGQGVERNMKRGFRHLLAAGELGNVTAMHTLGDWYRLYAEDSEAASKAEHWYGRALDGYQVLAERGKVEAMATLIVLYGRGRGAPRDPDQSYYWMRKCAEQDYPNAQYSLAGAYERGLGVDVDPAEAMYWYGRATENDFVPAIMSLAAIHANGELGQPRDPAAADRLFARAVEITKKAAGDGNADAQYLLSSLYFDGLGTPADTTEALRWLHIAGENDHPTAQLELGSRYSRGDDIPRDLNTALKWLHRAASQGNPEAQYLLGKAYDTSDALERDYVEAYKWFLLSADQGYKPAVAYLEELAITLSDQDIRDARQRARELKDSRLVFAAEEEVLNP